MRALLTLGVGLTGCAIDPPADAPTPDRASFAAVGEVPAAYEVLLRDCGFPACHGDEERFFRIYGPGRTRLDPMTVLGEPVTPEEIEVSYDRARSMLAGAEHPEDTLLLRKPLEVDRGGAPHLGIDEAGRDVYQTPDDPGYTTLLEWARTGFSEAAE